MNVYFLYIQRLGHIYMIRLDLGHIEFSIAKKSILIAIKLMIYFKNTHQ